MHFLEDISVRMQIQYFKRYVCYRVYWKS